MVMVNDRIPRERDRVARVYKPVIAQNPLVVPPRDVFITAGPNADKEIDYETLEGPGAVDPEAEPEMASIPDEPLLDEAPPAEEPIAKPLPGKIVINAVAVTSVKGSPGRGNAELTRAMRDVLETAGWPVLPSPRKDALTITGKVELGGVINGQQTVRLTWVVARPDGQVLGDLKQENTVEAGSLDQGWGENAGFVTEAAAEGIFKLIEGQR